MADRFELLMIDHQSVHYRLCASSDVAVRRAAHQALQELETEIVRQAAQQSPGIIRLRVAAHEYMRDSAMKLHGQARVNLNDYHCRVIRLLQASLTTSG